MSETRFAPPDAQLNNKNKEALTELNSKETRDYIIGTARSIKHGISEADADDVAQNVMFKANQAIEKGQFKHEANLKTWLHRITKNLILGEIRHESMKRRVGITDRPSGYIETKDDKPTPEQILIDEQENRIKESEIEKLKLDIQSLEPKYREIMELILQGKRPVDIANQFQIPYATVRTRIRKAKEILHWEK